MSSFKSGFATTARLLMGAAIVAGGIGLVGVSYAAVDNTPNVPGQPNLKIGGSEAPGLRNMVEQAQASLRKGDVKTAIIYLKNAVTMAPKNGQVRAELGYLLLRTGDAISAERELRQARADGADDQVVLPSLFQAMLNRGKERDLLEQFAEPAAGDNSVRAADILRARAIALQKVGEIEKANQSMDRSLSIRRDPPSLLTRATLAQQQGDLATATKVTDDALKMAPTDAGALMMKISLLQAQGQDQKALGYADQLVKYYPDSAAPKVARIGVYLKLKQDDKAKADINSILAKQPGLPIGVYYKAIVTARAKDMKAAWKLVQSLPPEFVRSQPAIGIAVAQIALDTDNKEVAHSVLSSVVAQYPQDAEARLRLGALRLQMKSPQQALDVLDPLKNSKDPRAMALLGQAYARMRKYSEATQYFEKASQAGLSNDVLKTQLALTELKSGQSEKAISQLTDLSQQHPESAETAGPLIAALLQNRRFDDAMKVATRLSNASPKNPLPVLYRGQIAMYQGDLAKAAWLFDSALKLDPKFVPARYYRAQALAAQGDVAGARDELNIVVKQDPKNSLAYIKLAQLAIQEGKLDDVPQLLGKAAAAAPKDPSPKTVLGAYYLSRKQYREADAAVTAALKIAPDNDEAIALQGQIQFARGNKDQASATFRRLVTRLPQSAGAQLLLGNALAGTKDQDGAISAFSRAIELDPTSMQSRNTLIDYAVQVGDSDRALGAAHDYAAAYPGPAADVLVADTLVKLKRADEAKNLLAKSYAAKPSQSVMLAYERISVATGDVAKARSLLSDWIRKNPNDVDALREYGSLLLTSGDKAGALKQFEAVLKLRPYDVIALNNVGWLIQKSDPKRAITLVSQAAKIQPQSAAILDTLGWLKWQNNAKDDALSLLQRAHSLSAGDPDIAYHLAVALDGSGKRNEAKALLAQILKSGAKFEDMAEAKQLAAKWK
ncbi:MAG TPA: XrtA/PEP-CTERM system TPR-repeat protein PrsT [Rhizomicrobium sp.]|nr:XrtA/PEP-CTERM system TPR-repeat protein PrsT [Rhizomicrobium sp.]